MPIARNYLKHNPPDQTIPDNSPQSHPVPRKLAARRTPSPRTPQQYAAATASSDSTGTLNAPFNGRISPTETRQELIDRVKRDQRATWLYNGGSLVAQTAPEHKSTSRPVSPPANESSSVSSDPTKEGEHVQGQMDAAMTIERPRSALHRGDFREQSSAAQAIPSHPDSPRPTHNPWLSTSPTTPWYTPRHEPPKVPKLRQELTAPAIKTQSETSPIPVQQRARAASHSAKSASFVFRPPTSPLVNETQPSDSERDDIPTRRRRHGSPERHARRKTFSPTRLASMRQRSFQGEYPERNMASLRGESTFPYQAHQPRRSTTSFDDPDLLPPIPTARSRRPSVASETSPLQRMPMVGRYEESILRGRMSSLPSRPLDFVAQIGVLGKGKCKPSLRCPPHVTVPFPAVFYHYGSRPGSPTSPLGSNGPSPYVGMVDIDSQLKLEEKARRRVVSSPVRLQHATHVDESGRSILAADGGATRHESKPRRPRQRVEHQLPRGGYRIPEQGQLQIIIKNPNKTAVKLFLVPYDLAGMEAGQKTFIRQRSYSAGPILDMPVSARKNFGTDRPEAALSNSDDPNDRPVLRYLIHLNICSPCKGRYYLYKSIRVVFANRVPDGKEKLRQEIQVPEPRFSTWKADKEGGSFTEKTKTPLHHFSYSGDFGPSVDNADAEGFAQRMAEGGHGAHGMELESRNFTFPLKALPTNMSRPPSRQAADADGDTSMADANSPLSPRSSSSDTHQAALLDSPSFRPSSRHTFERLSRDEYGNGSNGRERTQSPQPGRGLLALQLRDLADGGASQ